MSQRHSIARAVFLDRDGVIIRQVHHLHRTEQLRLLPGAAEGIARLNGLGYRTVVVTNQSVIGRGMATEQEVAAIHLLLRDRLRRKGAMLDAIYVCPHHPEAPVQRYRRRCRCRKPAVGMFEQAARDFGIGPRGSYMIGDRTVDIMAGKRFGLTTILVRTGYKGADKVCDVEPDFVTQNLFQAAELICRLDERRGTTRTGA